MAERGRPKEYKEEYVDKVDEYLEVCQDEEDEFHRTRGEKSDSYDRIIKAKLPTIEGFARFIDVAVSTLYLWKEEYSDFSEALEKIMVEQRERLINKGVSGEYNSTIAKLILSANHGMRDSTDVTTGGKPIKIGFDESFKD